ncbi:DNA-(apurinic or apyrimidinic site) lyase-like [Tropilaelaps mercedesae]|uniref:DNA-(apurinic or apyrimidinic site) endonuclease n=1 Tax=Tropilaelaps mercedesae TaxID=418985 RepID=A0A1V9XAX5_9ACAR|nr:DNA-(apurinic or apyrimidinic site) lyase-like [Tropilaelaps mercedesae]
MAAMFCRSAISTTRFIASSVIRQGASLHVAGTSGILGQQVHQINMPPRKVKVSSNVTVSTANQDGDVDTSRTIKRKRSAQKNYNESDGEDEDVTNEALIRKTAKHGANSKKPELSSSEDEDEPKVVSKAKKNRPSTTSSKKSKPEKATTNTGKQNSEGSEENVAIANYAKKGSLKIASWNINGIRAWLPKGGLDYISKEVPDVLCVQETKCSDDNLPNEIQSVNGYKSYFLAGDKKGYSGVGILTKIEPLKVTYGIRVAKHDLEGRVITMEFDDFFLVNVYVPNAGRGLIRLEYRMQWDKDFRAYLCKLKEQKAVILTGDLNVAHQEIDLANPKSNKRNAGFTQEERDGLTALLDQGFVDTFRRLYPDRAKAYTFWTYMMNARAKNVGWRLDYFIVSEQFIDRIIDNEIRDKVMGSDHCPIVLHIK